MKLRIKGNSLRLRLLRGEVEQFGKVGRVAETIRFGAPPAQLNYVLESDSETRQIAAHFSNNQITIKVPEQTAKDWAETEQVALKAEQLIDTAEPDAAQKNLLQILIEKDFVCLDRRDESDNLDAFPHPTGKSG